MVYETALTPCSGQLEVDGSELHMPTMQKMSVQVSQKRRSELLQVQGLNPGLHLLKGRAIPVCALHRVQDRGVLPACGVVQVYAVVPLSAVFPRPRSAAWGLGRIRLKRHGCTRGPGLWGTLRCAVGARRPGPGLPACSED